MRCSVCAIEEVPVCTFVVTFSRYEGGWLFSRHHLRDTWETQGGHIEPGETVEEAARRELYEESGAVPKMMHPVCGYWAEREGNPPRYGIVFLGDIDHLDPLPQSEIGEVQWFAALPEALSYPAITPVLYERVLACLEKLGGVL